MSKYFIYKTINTAGETPAKGTIGEEPNALIIKQISNDTGELYATSDNGKIIKVGLAGGENSSSNATPSLAQVLEVGNIATLPLHFSFNQDADGSNRESDNKMVLGYYTPSKDLGFGPLNKENLSKRTTLSFNTYFGYNSQNKLTTGKRNVSVGVNALSSNTASSYNTAIGSDALRLIKGELETTMMNTAVGSNIGIKLTEGRYNTFIGANSATALPKGASLTFVGAYSGYSLNMDDFGADDVTTYTPIISKYLTGVNKGMATLFGYNAEKNTMSSSSSTYIGYGNGSTSKISRTVNSVWIGSNPLNSNFIHRDYNNIVIGNYLSTRKANSYIMNSVLIGSFFEFKTGSHTEDNILAIHNSKTESTDPKDALIYGEFENRKLKLNGAVTINPRNTPSVNNTFTKVAIANDNGDLTFLTLGQLKGLLEGVTAETLPS